MKLKINKKILAKNEDCAAANRKFLKDKNILCINMISSPGSGKTTTLEKTINMLKGKVNIAVIEGDLQTQLDAERIRATGAQAIQIETKGACHLSAAQVTNAIHTLNIDQIDIIIIENVGNLVCPSDFDLGEEKRVVLVSVPEGDEKCAKYPKAFAKADVLLINKIDLLEHLDFDVNRIKKDALKLKKDLKIFEISAKTGDGFEDWLNWLTKTKK
ncbi:MAG: hydrogenase nickel incorporation protein HypB [Sedimentisphaerales bacterium]|nr:hydrogenase nickel incorporation protein HypB [Sedimentisphaerales bacterium]